MDKNTFGKLNAYHWYTKDLQRLAYILHKLNEVGCERELTKQENNYYKEKQEEVERLANELDLKVAFGGDPRTASFKLVMPENKKKDFYELESEEYLAY